MSGEGTAMAREHGTPRFRLIVASISGLIFLSGIRVDVTALEISGSSFEVLGTEWFALEI